MREELLKKSLKRELSDDDLSTSLSDILGDDFEKCGLYSAFGITRLGDLLSIDYKDLVKAQDDEKIKHLSRIKRAVHKCGCTLKGEYDDLGISEEETLIPVTELGVSSRVIHALKRSGCIDVFGELLSVPYSKLANISHFGAKSQNELKAYIKSLGYDLQDSGINVDMKKEQLRRDGEILVEDVIDSRLVMLTLNRAGIYTLDGLLERDLHSISGIGKMFEEEIIQSLKKLKLENLSQCTSSSDVAEMENELVMLQQRRNMLRMRKVALVLEQAEVNAELRAIKARISGINVGVQYEKK